MVPEIEYMYMTATAQRIEWCHRKYSGIHIKIMKGDVNGAFRYLMLASGHVCWMAATITQLGVANETLRMAMMAILAPRAINENKKSD